MQKSNAHTTLELEREFSAKKEGRNKRNFINFNHMAQKKNNGEKELQILANELVGANTHFYFGKELNANSQRLCVAKIFWEYTVAAHCSIAFSNLCRVYDVQKKVLILSIASSQLMRRL
jgi:hypothetical protein